MSFAAVALLSFPQAALDLKPQGVEECRLTGRAVDVVGAPIAGAELVLWLRRAGASEALASALSDSDGRFVLDVPLRDGRGATFGAFLTLHSPGLAPSLLDNVFLPPPAYDLGPVTLYPPVELRGRVLDGDGRPVVGAEIHAALGKVLAPHVDHVLRPPVAVTDAHGEYACLGLPPGTVTLGASAPGFADLVLAPLELHATDSNRVDFTLARERSVRLRVTSGGQALDAAQAEPLGERWTPLPWARQREHLAFWRGTVAADPGGWITLDALSESFRGEVRVQAYGFRPELVALTANELEVELAPVTWIEVVASSRDGGPPPELYRVVVRDTTREPSWCGNCDDSRLAKLWGDSPGVERLAPDRWRIAWNGLGCYVDGGSPGNVSGTTVSGVFAFADIEEEGAPGVPRMCRLVFDPPARLTGVVRSPDGAPVSIRLGLEVDFDSTPPFHATSGPDGRFEFERLGPGWHWIDSLDEDWAVDSACQEVELQSGRTTEIVVTVRPEPARTGRVVGLLTVGGTAPGAAVLLALNAPYPTGFAWTDAAGRFEFRGQWPRAYDVVPKHTPPPSGYRDFAAEFPVHERWKWKIRFPEEGLSNEEIELPEEEVWDTLSPPKSGR